jgi:hypothetical protein
VTTAVPQNADALLDEAEHGGDWLAGQLCARYQDLSAVDAAVVARGIVDRIVFIRFCEDRGVLPRNGLRAIAASEPVQLEFDERLRRVDIRFHGWLAVASQNGGPSMAANDFELRALIERWDAKDLTAVGIDTLGRLYERALEREHRGARKSRGVYYTPDHIVRYVVDGTIGGLLEGLSPAEVAELCFLDPACGSGSFLLGAFERLIEWHTAWYATHASEGRDGRTSPSIFRDARGAWKLNTAKRVEILLNNIFGVDLDERALAVTKLSLSLRALEGSLEGKEGEVIPSLVLLDDNIRCGNSLVDTDFDYHQSFPRAFARGGFDAVFGNPPYVSYGGRQAVRIPPRIRRYFARNYESGGWATAHSLFMERSAKQLSRRLVSFIVPDQVGHLMGYRSLRELLVKEGHISEVKYWGENVFKGVVTPSLTFILDKAGREGATRIINHDGTEHRVRIDGGDPWTSSAAKALLDKLKTGATSIRRYLADCGVRTTDAKAQVVELRTAPGRFVAVLEGKQIGRYSCAPPSVAVRLDAGSKVFVSRDEKYAKAEFLIRQTAAYPIVGPREHATYFRNSLHALYAPDNGWDVRYVVGLLNSKLIRFAYVASVRESHQRAFPQVKLGPLGALPIRALRLEVADEKKQHDRVVELVAAMLEVKHELGQLGDANRKAALVARTLELDARIDAEVFCLYGLEDSEIANVESVVAALATPP